MTKRITPALLREAADMVCATEVADRSISLARTTLGTSDTSSYGDDLAAILNATADAMERDYLPMPVGKDGETVRVGDEVFVDGEGPCAVEGLYLGTYGGWDVRYETPDGTRMTSVAYVTHERPDSWESIIDDAYALGGWAEEMVGDGPDYSTTDLVERCRRLAGES